MINNDLDTMGKSIAPHYGFKQTSVLEKLTNPFVSKIGGSVVSGQEIFSVQEPTSSR